MKALLFSFLHFDPQRGHQLLYDVVLHSKNIHEGMVSL
jgi:hypothetical protein